MDNVLNELNAVGDVIVEGTVDKIVEFIQHFHVGFNFVFGETSILNAVVQELDEFYQNSEEMDNFYGNSTSLDIEDNFIDDSLMRHGVNTSLIINTAINDTISEINLQKDSFKQRIIDNMNASADATAIMTVSNQIDESFTNVTENSIHKLKELFKLHKQEILTLCQQYRQNKQQPHDIINIENVLELSAPLYHRLRDVIDEIIAEENVVLITFINPIHFDYLNANSN